MKKNICLFFILFGMSLILVNYVINLKCEKVVYKYIPYTLQQLEEEPVYVSQIFDKMFNSTTPWAQSIKDIDYSKVDKINKYFISQV